MSEDQDAVGKPPEKGRRLRTKKENQEDSIMSTNNSCIVSKRSVEKIYHKDDDGFLRYFVNKFQRRSPLINRGYWLRMTAIDHVVRTFLQSTSRKKKVVINLGCGYDPLPFRFLSREATMCQDSIFVDVDYERLILKKCDIIRSTPQLTNIVPALGQVSRDIVLSSQQYKAVACDLEDVRKLDQIVHSIVDTDEYAVLFLAEVSITYMDAKAAETLIQWASQLSDAHFCVLEQYLPAGTDHPFASTMLRHFNKLQSPLKSALRFPSLADQRARFLAPGWSCIRIRSLWELWSDDKFLKPAEREALDDIEPFDEWEEFAMFASHYFLLVASTGSASTDSKVSRAPEQAEVQKLTVSGPLNLACTYTAIPKLGGCRRFGATLRSGNAEIAHIGGHGTRGRLNDCDIIERLGHAKSTVSRPSDIWATASDLMCHTITEIGDGEFLLVGGRASPNSASNSCFLRYRGRWVEVDKLPFDLYRHCAVSVCKPESDLNHGVIGVVVFGGKSASGKVRDDWLLWQRGAGWRKLHVEGDEFGMPRPRFGASMSTFENRVDAGLLTGGMSKDGKVLSDVWQWELVGRLDVRIQCTNLTSRLKFANSAMKDVFARFGSTLMSEPEGFLLIGGVTGNNCLVKDTDILRISHYLRVDNFSLGTSVPQPMLVGCGVVRIEKTTLLIVGGGAVCFSFGTFWNEGTYSVRLGPSTTKPIPWNLQSPVPSLSEQSTRSQSRADQHLSYQQTKSVSMVADRAPTTRSGSKIKPEVGRIVSVEQLFTEEGFKTIVLEHRPVILRGLDLGACTDSWNMGYLKQKLGEKREVVVHAARNGTMNFQEKNFTYQTLPFGDFIDKISAGEPMYLRSLSTDKPADKVTNLASDFPEIASNFALPPQLQYAIDNAHSSPFRISGPVTMWLHYDVMANVLCQIHGSKRLLLFPPSDIYHLSFPPGATSSQLNIFDETGATKSIPSTHPIVFDLQPGDVLFIPALWPHTAQPIDGISVAVNVFFRSLESGYAAGKDVYGNRDLQAYENGRRDVARLVKNMRGLPKEAGGFYMKRLAKEMMDLAEQWER